MIDFIGDIHGHQEALDALLKKLGYEKRGGAYRHAERTAVFLGDYIDRGPQAREVVQTVRAMVEAGSAQAILGNHEFNALCFWLKKEGGGYLREHTINKILMHTETMRSYRNRRDEFQEMLEWFRTLPLYLETETFRALHACWDSRCIEILRRENITSLKDETLIRRAATEGDPIYFVLERLLKGPEVALPPGISFFDIEGVQRTRTRIRWWNPPGETDLSKIAIQPGTELPKITLKENVDYEVYGENERPVFFGHYWLSGEPKFFKDNVCCLDYSIGSTRFQGKL
ncbi:MAG: metallophosphoesterase, partial [Fibrobacter sp.]|nr:metallophosphoesterase [Fibrobacter sp.]